MARLELQESLGSENERAIAQEIAATKRALKDNTLKDCVGKRITDQAMHCVRQAESAKQAVEDCFD